MVLDTYEIVENKQIRKPERKSRLGIGPSSAI